MNACHCFYIDIYEMIKSSSSELPFSVLCKNQFVENMWKSHKISIKSMSIISNKMHQYHSFGHYMTETRCENGQNNRTYEKYLPQNNRTKWIFL